jgi:hypothetical protein
MIKNKKNPGKGGQEEMVGFALIIIFVSIILLFLLVFYLRGHNRQGIESYEVNSFIQSFLHYTTDCEDYFGGIEVRKLIFKCNDGIQCLDGRNSCDVLEETLKDIAGESWPFGPDRPVKGYELKIITNSKETLSLQQGNQTNNFRGAMQDFTIAPDSVEVSFKAYYE